MLYRPFQHAAYISQQGVACFAMELYGKELSTCPSSMQPALAGFSKLVAASEEQKAGNGKQDGKQARRAPSQCISWLGYTRAANRRLHRG